MTTATTIGPSELGRAEGKRSLSRRRAAHDHCLGRSADEKADEGGAAERDSNHEVSDLDGERTADEVCCLLRKSHVS